MYAPQGLPAVCISVLASSVIVIAMMLGFLPPLGIPALGFCVHLPELLAYSRFLGLDKDKETGKIVVNLEQAETVRLIFHLFLEGMTPHSIAAELTSRGIKTPAGKDVWNQQTVRRMLSKLRTPDLIQRK